MSVTVTWKRFKELLEEAGVKDDMEILYIDVTIHYDTESEIGVEKYAVVIHGNSFHVSD